jgi:hypothetical protein
MPNNHNISLVWQYLHSLNVYLSATPKFQTKDNKMKNPFFALFCLLILGFFSSAQAQAVDMGIFNNALKELRKTVSIKPGVTAKKAPAKARQTTTAKPPASRTTARSTRTPKNTTVARSRTQPKKDVEAEVYSSEETPVETIEETPVEADVVAIDTTYRSTQGIILVEKMLAQADPNDPQTALFKEIITRGWADYQTSSETKGYQYNDLARALSFFIGTNYNLYHNKPMLTPEQVRGLYNQMKEQFGSTAALAKMKDEEKQLFCELLVFLTSVPTFANAVGTEQNNSELVNQSRDLAKQNLETLLGTSVDKLAFNDEGLTLP